MSNVNIIENLMDTVQKVEQQQTVVEAMHSFMTEPDEQVMRCFGCGARMECNWCPEGECECRKDEQVMCGSCLWLRESR